VGDVQGFNVMGVEGVLVSSFLSKFGGFVDKVSGVFTNCFLIFWFFAVSREADIAATPFLHPPLVCKKEQQVTSRS